MAFGVTTTILAANVANSGTFTVPYPAGTTQGFYTNGLAGSGHVLIVGENDAYTSGFTLAFDANVITVTNASLGTLPAGTFVRLQVERQGANSFSGPAVNDNDVVYLSFGVALAAVTAVNQDIVNSFVPGIRGTIEHMQYVPNVAGSAGNNVVLTPRVGSTTVTGGSVTLAAATTGANAAAVQGTPITAGAALAPDSTLSVRATALTTAFSAGSGTIVIRIRRAPSL